MRIGAFLKSGASFAGRALERALRREVARVCGNSATLVTGGYPFISFRSKKAERRWNNSANWKRLSRSVTGVGLGRAVVRYI